MSGSGAIDGLGQAALILMLRAGVIGDDDVVALADEYDRRASWERPGRERERLEMTAHHLRVTLLMVDEAPAVDPASEYRAQFQRQQMRDRTRLLGGNDDA